jgi:cell division septation protein DedD
MRRIIKVTMATFVAIMFFVAGLSAMAEKPAFTGLKCPLAVDGKTGAVTGRVTSALNTTGIAGAYIAVVNASNVSEEYFNTTSDAYGYYQILGINASYNATNTSAVGPNGPTPYKVYANHTLLGEGYSAAFGIDASSPGTGPGGIPPITFASTPTAVATPVSTPTATAVPATPTPTTPPVTATVPAPTATPQPTPGPSALSVLLAGCVAVLVLRNRKN